jgi:ABC-type phosphate transport system substrate-binding protein
MKLAIVTILLLLSWPEASLSQVAVIAHKSVPIDHIEMSELLDFFTGDIKKWNDEQPVEILDFKPRGDIKKAFYKFLGKSPSRMKSIWLKKMLSGEGDPPLSMKSEMELLEKVASPPVSIGFVGQRQPTVDVNMLLWIEEEK